MKIRFSGSPLSFGYFIRAVLMGAALISLAMTSCKNRAVDPFPASGAISGWEKSSDTRIFAAKDLWQYIDGDAEQYVSAGVVTTSTSDYKYQGQLEAVVDIYTMGNAGGAAKILSTNQSKDAKNVTLGDAGVAYTQSVLFQKGRNLVRIVAYQSTPHTQETLLALAHGVEARL